MLCNLVGSYQGCEGTMDLTFRVGMLEEIGCPKTVVGSHQITMPCIPAGSKHLCTVICGSSCVC